MQLIRLTRIFFTYVVMSWHFCAMPSYTILDLPDELLISIYDLLYYKQMEQFTASYNPEDPQEYQLFLLHYYCFIMRDKSEQSFKNLKNVNKKLHRLYSPKIKQLENTKFDPLILYQYCKDNNIGRSPFNSDDVCYIQYDGVTYKKTKFFSFIFPQIKTRHARFSIEQYLTPNANWFIFCSITSDSPLKFEYKNLSKKNALAFLTQYIRIDPILESIYDVLNIECMYHVTHMEHKSNPIKECFNLDAWYSIPIRKEVPSKVVYKIFNQIEHKKNAK